MERERSRRESEEEAEHLCVKGVIVILHSPAVDYFCARGGIEELVHTTCLACMLPIAWKTIQQSSSQGRLLLLLLLLVSRRRRDTRA
eukprot:967891-Rhodomonas_salina.1